VSAPFFALVRSGLAGLFLGATQPGWAVLLAAAITGIWAIPTPNAARLLRTVLGAWIVLVLPLVAAAGGPISLMASSHAAALLLMMGAYGVAGVLAALAPSVLGVRVEEPRWTPLLLGMLLAATWALRPARTLGEFFILWAALGLGCVMAYLWTERERGPWKWTLRFSRRC